LKETISIKLFGGLRIRSADGEWKTAAELVGGSIGKKQRAFLTYLLLHHDRRITAAELIEHFWPGESKDPANSLKNMMHKIRVLLREILPVVPDLIMTRSGHYEWNPDVCLELDVESFEQLYHETKRQGTAEGVQQKLEAFELYNGDILPGSSEEWLDPLNTYYQTVYIDICKALAVQLLDEQRFEEVVRVCSRAYALAPEVEESTICAMHAMVGNGLPGQAVKQYEDYRDMLWRQFDLVPSLAVEQAYTLAVYASRNAEDTEEKIVRQLLMPAEQREAFQCGLLVFQNIVRLELRHLERSERPSSVVLLHVEGADATEPSSTDIRRMERVLLQSLRTGDPFTRLNLGSFALLLPGASAENGRTVMERVERDFHSTYPRSKAHLRYNVYPMKARE